jgi:hypothetical protein
MIQAACEKCGKPAIGVLIKPDGSRLPLCGDHIFSGEPESMRKHMEQFLAKNKEPDGNPKAE